ncbi:MAG TPA: hypothetical protein VMB53_03695 [Gaiellaceae bacterium]|nr:hypothetical protein [Gaiellaceae bacterium]
MRRCLAWLVAVPLMLAGSEAAHVLAYRVAYPALPVRLHALLATGHGYWRWLPLAFGVAAAVVALSLAVTAADAARGRRSRGLPAWAFALLPPVAWVVQEHLELWIHAGVFPWHEFARPTFLPGLALQLPFALLAYLAARLLLRVAEDAGRAVARLAPPRARAVVPSGPPSHLEPSLPRVTLIACGLAKRGPPLSACV